MRHSIVIIVIKPRFFTSFTTRCSLNFVIILNSAISAAALVFDLPGMCTHTDTEGKQGKARVWNILKSKKHNIS